MRKFSRDKDILKVEPELFGDCHLPSQVIASGSDGVVSGTVFTSSSAKFSSCGVSAGNVLFMESQTQGFALAVEIVSVDSDTQLQVSVLRSDEEPLIEPPQANDIVYRICSYDIQAEEIGYELMECFGVSPAKPASELSAEQITGEAMLKQVSVYGVLVMVYSMNACLSQSDADNWNYWKKVARYRNLFEQAKQRCWLSFDTDGDGKVDRQRDAGVFNLRRK